jgi:diaminopropionate ammonia-lyase
MSIVRNPLRVSATAAPPPPDALGLLHRRLPGYTPTELCSLPRLARRWQVGRVLAKAETERFGLPSFKVLGASWAVYETLLQRAGLDLRTPYEEQPRAELVHAAGLRGLVTATDGNHGRAVAWAARLFGLQADVVVPAGTARARIAAITDEGARVHVSEGDYDAACREAAGHAQERAGSLLVQDTWLEGHTDVPSRIVAGYATLFAEIDALLPRGEVDAAFIPVGVGSLALAAVRHYAADPAVLVAVEPADADCLQRSLVGGRPVTVAGPYATQMAGLNCGTPNELAWPELSTRLDATVTVDDAAAAGAMGELAVAGIDAGATGAASAAGAAAVLSDGPVRDRLGLDASSTVLLLVTEGVTDPAHHRAVVGA